MWIMLLLLPMPPIISACMAALPKPYQRVPAAIGWTLLLPCLIALTYYLMPVMAGPSASTYEIMVILAAMGCYFVIRATAFLGLDFSFRAYGKDKQFVFPLAGTLLAWVLTILEPAGVLTVFLLSYFMDYPGKFDAVGMTEVFFVVMVILLSGVCVSYMLLLIMNSNRKDALGLASGAHKRGAEKGRSDSKLGPKPASTFKNAPAVERAPVKAPPSSSSAKAPKGPAPYHPPPAAAPKPTIPLARWPGETPAPLPEEDSPPSNEV